LIHWGCGTGHTVEVSCAQGRIAGRTSARPRFCRKMIGRAKTILGKISLPLGSVWKRMLL